MFSTRFEKKIFFVVLTEDLFVVLEVVRSHGAYHRHGHALLHDLLLERFDLVLVFLWGKLIMQISWSYWHAQWLYSYLSFLLESLLGLLLLLEELLLDLLELLGHLGLEINALLDLEKIALV